MHLETDIERMMMDCVLMKTSYESIDLYINDIAHTSKLFVAKLTTMLPTDGAPKSESRHFRDVSFFQCLKRLQNHLYYRDEDNNSKYV